MERDVRTVHAHAKVNLDLRVLATRDDGYHEIATVFQTITLHDVLVFRLAPGPMRIVGAPPGVPDDESNLVWRAAAALWRTAGRAGPPAGLVVELDKRVPAQAGLGGGSADAAATLVALDGLWRLRLPLERLAEVASGLGADVPFFLVGGSAEGRGRGDRIRPLPDLPCLEVLVAVPAFGVSTADAYRWHDDDRLPPSRPGTWPERDAAGWRQALRECRNDLERPVVSRHPAIGEMVGRLGAGAVLAAMSGSGSAVFGLYDRAADADAAASAARRAGWRALRAATLDRERYGRLSWGGP